jgi:hypothetical protein
MSRFRQLFQDAWAMGRKDPAYVLLHLGTATGLAGFTLSDPLPLRACSITSSLASIVFIATRVPVASMVPVYWSSCFIAVNSFKIYQLLMERRAVELEKFDEDIYARHFMRSGMRPRQFKVLRENAVLREFEDGDILHSEGSEAPTTVKLLINGRVQIKANEEEIFTVDAKKPICFLGDTHVLEMADRLAEKKDSVTVPSFSATAVAMAPKGEKVVVLEWENAYLVKLLTQSSETAHSLRAVLTNSMVQKLVDIGNTGALDKYTTLMFACAADGSIKSLEKTMLSDYAKRHKINETGHESALLSIGWTAADYNRGYVRNSYAVPVLSAEMWAGLRARLRGNLRSDKISSSASTDEVAKKI